MSPSNQVEQQVPAPPRPPLEQPAPNITILPGGNGTPFQLPGFPTRPLTARDVQALRARGGELSRQLSSANGRRNDLANAWEDASGSNRNGIEQRIAQLDQRIMGIEADIAANGRLLASVPANTSNQNTNTTQPPNPFGLSAGQVTAMGIVATVFVLFPLALAAARMMWRRGSRPAALPVSAESSQRMERLEQAVDAIAIEVERISEGQRFVTRLLTEGSAHALGIGQQVAEPVRLPDREPARASRERA